MTDTLFAGGSLVVGDELDRLTSNNDKLSVIMQSDGNLVIYYNPRNRPIWASQTSGSGAISADMQDDGNLVLYTADDQPVWASQTNGHGSDCRLIMQDDGNLVIYDANDVPIWASQTNGLV